MVKFNASAGLMKKVLVVAGLFLIFAGLVSASDVGSQDIRIGTSSSVATITSFNIGASYVFVENRGDHAGTLSLSVVSNHLTAYFDSPSVSLPAHATAGSNLHFSAPDCFRGSETLIVYGQFCSRGKCEVASTKVNVYVTPAKTCTSYIEGFATREFFTQGDQCLNGGCDEIGGKVVTSTIIDTVDYAQTGYAVKVDGPISCQKVVRGERLVVPLTVLNRGASATFDIGVIADDDLNVLVNKDYVSLQRSEASDVQAYFYPDKNIAEGRHFAAIQALFNKQLVAQKEVCIDLVDVRSVEINVQPGVEMKVGASPLKLVAQIQNTGTAAGDYSIEVESIGNAVQAVDLQQRLLSLQAGEKASILLQVNPSKLKLGSNKVLLIVEGGDAVSSREIDLIVKQDAVEATVTGEPALGVEEIKFTLLIQNDEDTAVKDVRLEFSGIPAGWEVTSESGFDIPAKSEKRVDVTIKAATGEEAQPVVTIKSGDRVLSVQRLPTVKGRQSGLTGLFTATLSQNLPLIAVLLVVAVLVIMMFARTATVQDSDKQFRQNYAMTLEQLKHEAAK